MQLSSSWVGSKQHLSGSCWKSQNRRLPKDWELGGKRAAKCPWGLTSDHLPHPCSSMRWQEGHNWKHPLCPMYTVYEVTGVMIGNMCRPAHACAQTPLPPFTKLLSQHLSTASPPHSLSPPHISASHRLFSPSLLWIMMFDFSPLDCSTITIL